MKRILRGLTLKPHNGANTLPASLPSSSSSSSDKKKKPKRSTIRMSVQINPAASLDLLSDNNNTSNSNSNGSDTGSTGSSFRKKWKKSKKKNAKVLEDLLTRKGAEIAKNIVPLSADMSPPLDPDPAKLPAFIFDAISDIEARGINQEGIFRKSSKKIEEDELFSTINKTPSSDLHQLHIDFSKYSDIHLAANILKKYLRNLQEPLLTFGLYQTFLSTQQIVDSANSNNNDNSTSLVMLRKACTLLPESNYELLKILCRFLKRVSDHQRENMMTSDNLSIVFQPNLLYLKDQHPLEAFNQMNTAIGVIKSLIDNCDAIFGETDQVQPMNEPFVMIDESSSGEYNDNNQNGTDGSHHSSNDQQVKSSRRASMIQSSQLGEASDVQVYTGDVNELGMKHGKGKLMLPDGRIYTGDFMNDLFHGQGEMIEPNGAWYVGEWALGKKEGKGVMYYADQCRYEGSWSNDVRSGSGMIIYPDGSIYDGKWLNDKPHGDGIFIDHNECKYVGEWSHGKYHGKGTLQIYATNETYEGEFVEGEYDGDGKYTSTSVRGTHIYEGTFKSAVPWNGCGSIASDSKTVYTGQWIEGAFSGEAYMEFPDGKIYEGQMDNFLFHGDGVMNYTDGTIYSGAWKHGKKDGWGKQCSFDGAVYEGEFKDGMFDGEGTLSSADGEYVFEGEFKMDTPWMGTGVVAVGEDLLDGTFYKGMFYGTGKKRNSDGSLYEGEFKKSEFHGKGKMIYPDGTMFDGEFKNHQKLKGIFTDRFGIEYEVEYDPNSGDEISSVQMIAAPSEEKKRQASERKIASLLKRWQQMSHLLNLSEMFETSGIGHEETQQEQNGNLILQLGTALASLSEQSEQFAPVLEMLIQLTQLAEAQMCDDISTQSSTNSSSFYMSNHHHYQK